MDFQKQQRPLLDLNDYSHKLVRHPKHKGAFECPVCTVGKFTFSSSKATDFTCWTNGCDRGEICKVLTRGESTFLSDEQKARNEAAAHAQVEKERARKEALKSSEQKNTEFLATLSQRTLSTPHRQDMLDRGYTPEQIEASGAKSFSKGRVFPIFDYTGKMVGVQGANKGKGGKAWALDIGNTHLKETDENPLAVIYPIAGVKLKKGLLEIGFCEGTGDKPFLAANRLGSIMIGSSSIGTQPRDLARTIKGIKAKYGAKAINCTLYPDAGMFENALIMPKYAKLRAQIAELGYELKVCWWNQYLKDTDPDIDEVAVGFSNKVIDYDKYLKIGEDRATYNTLSSLDRKNPIFDGAVTTSNERYISEIPAKPGTVTFISSPCGTGKTVGLTNRIKAHRKLYPNSRVFSLTHLDAIRSMQQGLWGIENWKVGFGQSQAALESFWGVALCPDSLDKLPVHSIPAHSLFIMDELEALLEHCAIGGTLGSRKANIQAHLSAILDRILVSGGSIIGLEDNLTNLSIDLMHRLTNGNYNYELIVNEYKAQPWNVVLSKMDKPAFASMFLNALEEGETPFLVTSSQVLGEQLHELAEKEFKMGEGILRIDSKTKPDHPEFMASPEKYLLDNPVKSVIASPTVKSGFSVNIPGRFTSVHAYLSGGDTRDGHQLLNRLRDNDVTRYIAASERGYGACMLPLNVEKLAKLLKINSNEIHLVHGLRVPFNSEAEKWNIAYAQFSVRNNISQTYLYQYQRLELISRGHNVVEMAMSAAREGMKDELKEVKESIEWKDSTLIAESDTKGVSLHEAVIKLGSPDVTHKEKSMARKRVAEDRWPGMPLTSQHVKSLMIERKGQLGKQYDFWFLCKNPEWAKALDYERVAQNFNAAHVLDAGISYQGKQVTMMQPIVADLMDLGSGRDFDNYDPAVKRIADWAIKNSYDLRRFFRFQFKAKTDATNGKTANSATATANKMLKAIGFKSERTSQRRENGERISVYSVTNTNCEMRADIEKALTTKFKAIELKGISTEIEIKVGMMVLIDGGVEAAEVIDIRTYRYNSEIVSEYQVKYPDQEYPESVLLEQLKRA